MPQLATAPAATNPIACCVATSSCARVRIGVAASLQSFLTWYPSVHRGRVARCRCVECDAAGTFGVEAVEAVRYEMPRPPPSAAPAPPTSPAGSPRSMRSTPPPTTGGPGAVDAAQLAPHRPLPRDADYRA